MPSFLLGLNSLLVLIAILFLWCGYRTQREWLQARDLIFGGFIGDRELTSRWVDFATPLLPWSLRRGHIVTSVASCVLFSAIVAFALLVSSSIEARIFAGWCLIPAAAAGIDAARVASSRHRTLRHRDD